MSGPLDQEEFKKVAEEAIDRWLDKRYAELGKWTARGFAAATVAALGYFILHSYGWHK